MIVLFIVLVVSVILRICIKESIFMKNDKDTIWSWIICGLIFIPAMILFGDLTVNLLNN